MILFALLKFFYIHYLNLNWNQAYTNNINIIKKKLNKTRLQIIFYTCVMCTLLINTMASRAKKLWWKFTAENLWKKRKIAYNNRRATESMTESYADVSIAFKNNNKFYFLHKDEMVPFSKILKLILGTLRLQMWARRLSGAQEAQNQRFLSWT